MIELNKTLRRKVQTSRGEPLVVALTKEGIWLKEPRRRVAYLLTYGYAFQRAADMYGEAVKREKKAARAAKKLARRGR